MFLHYVYDLWVHHWRSTRTRGEVIVVRYADDTVVGFQYESDAKQFHNDLKERLLKFGLELHPEKTRLIEFGRFASENKKKRKEGKPDTFAFLGFTHICGKTREKGKFTIWRQTIKKRMQKKLKEIKDDLKSRMHETTQGIGRWLKTVVTGHYNYFGVPDNFKAMNHFRYLIGQRWKHSIKRRSQKGSITWDKMGKLIDRWLPKPRICHKYPGERFGVTI